MDSLPNKLTPRENPGDSNGSKFHHVPQFYGLGIWGQAPQAILWFCVRFSYQVFWSWVQDKLVHHMLAHSRGRKATH